MFGDASQGVSCFIRFSHLPRVVILHLFRIRCSSAPFTFHPSLQQLVS
jgi:hypothetical protein